MILATALMVSIPTEHALAQEVTNKGNAICSGSFQVRTNVRTDPLITYSYNRGFCSSVVYFDKTVVLTLEMDREFGEDVTPNVPVTVRLFGRQPDGDYVINMYIANEGVWNSRYYGDEFGNTLRQDGFSQIAIGIRVNSGPPRPAERFLEPYGLITVIANPYEQAELQQDQHPVEPSGI